MPKGSDPVTSVTTDDAWANGMPGSARTAHLAAVEYAGGMFKPGDLVRHRNMPDWGLGRVSGEMGDGKVLLKFTGRKGDVMLSQDGADKFLVLDPTAVWTATPGTKVRRPAATGRSSSRGASASPRPTAAPLMPSPFTKQPPRRIPCVNCAAPLSEVVSSPDGTWRSCPSCSSRSGRHHVFLPYPSAFDVTDDVPVAELATAALAELAPAPLPQLATAALAQPAPAALAQAPAQAPAETTASEAPLGPHPGTADEADAAHTEPENPQAGWCSACLAGELATGYKTCMKVL